MRFEVVDGKGLLPENTYFVIWTTTPWTLPANVAICLHPDYIYSVVQVNGTDYVVAKERLEPFLEVLRTGKSRVEAEYPGRKLEGIICRHPFVERDSLVVLGDYVTLEYGTGCVHNAPGHL